jgi:hypothetical protein
MNNIMKVDVRMRENEAEKKINQDEMSLSRNQTTFRLEVKGHHSWIRRALSFKKAILVLCSTGAGLNQQLMLARQKLGQAVSTVGGFPALGQGRLRFWQDAVYHPILVNLESYHRSGSREATFVQPCGYLLLGWR